MQKEINQLRMLLAVIAVNFIFKMLKVYGFVKTSLIDYPGKICSVIFLSGCNFRCPFCHNRDLVLKNNLNEFSKEEIFEILNKRKNLLDGVCITGGEPLINSYEDISLFIRNIKKINSNFLIKIDTNGTNPKLLKKLIDEKLVNFVAMDIKNSFKKYNQTTNSHVDLEKIQDSIKIIRKEGKKENIDYEFRMTVLPEFHSENDLLEIGKNLNGSKKFVIQSFIPQNTLDKNFEDKESFSKEKIENFVKILKSFFEIVELRV